MSDEESEMAAIRRELRSRGWYLRYTEWPTGHQVVLHRRSDTAVHVVTPWCATELEAWREALASAVRHVEATGESRDPDERHETPGRSPGGP